MLPPALPLGTTQLQGGAIDEKETVKNDLSINGRAIAESSLKKRRLLEER